MLPSRTPELDEKKKRFVIAIWFLPSSVIHSPFSPKVPHPMVAKNASRQVNNKNFDFVIIKLTYVPLPWQHE